MMIKIFIPEELREKYPKSSNLVEMYLEEMFKRKVEGKPLLTYATWLSSNHLLGIYARTRTAGGKKLLEALYKLRLVLRQPSARGGDAYVPVCVEQHD